MREFKFRAWSKEHKAFIAGFNMVNFHSYFNAGLEPSIYRYNTTWKLSEIELMQYTGFKDKNGKEIYENDIFRIEENGTEIDEVDRIFYVVVIWIKEWGMFGTLHSREYSQYLIEGIKALDEPMFWTYTLEDTDSRKHFLCGNIYQNPDLLK